MSGGGGSQTTETRNTPWEGQQPFLEDIFRNASSLYGGGQLGAVGGESDVTNLARGLRVQEALAPNLTDNARAVANATLGGGFLDMQNPYFQDAVAYSQQPVIDAFNEQIAPNIDAAFERAGAGGFGSNAYASVRNRAEDTLARNLAGAATTAGMQMYGDERQRQQQILGLAPGLDAARYADLGQLSGVGAELDARSALLAQQPYQALRQYAGLVTSTPQFGTSTTRGPNPNQTDPFALGLGGALSLASLFA